MHSLQIKEVELQDIEGEGNNVHYSPKLKSEKALNQDVKTYPC